MNALALVIAILATYPVPARERACIESRAVKIAAHAEDAAAAYVVPVSTLESIGFLEGHFGCSRRSNGSWGVVAWQSRGTPARAAARALRRGIDRCGPGIGAISNFRYGRCRPINRPGYTPRYALAFESAIIIAVSP